MEEPKVKEQISFSGGILLIVAGIVLVLGMAVGHEVGYLRGYQAGYLKGSGDTVDAVVRKLQDVLDRHKVP